MSKIKGTDGASLASSAGLTSVERGLGRSAGLWPARDLAVAMALGLVILAWTACAQKRPSEVVVDNIPASRADSSTEFSQLILTNGETTVNDRCPVRKSKLNTKLPTVFVNGRAVAFC